MCGIVGVMTEKLFLGDYMRFKDLFVMAQVRGDEGAGILAVPKKDKVDHVKVRRTTWSSGHLVTTTDYDQCLQGDNSVLIGHARQPTKGGTTLKSVHPHSAGNNVYLVHNGTMSNVDKEVILHTESDSSRITRCIHDKGVKHFVENSSGAYCLVWVDQRDQTLNFIRNKERPLWMCEVRNSKFSADPASLWWASESWMITIALSRYAGYDKDCVKLYQLPENEHWSYPLQVPRNVQEPTKTKVEKPLAVYNNNYYGFDDWEEGGHSLVPFHRNSSNASVGSSENNALGTSTNKDKFSYVPPEHRGGVSSSSSRTVTSFTSPARVLEDSQSIATMATARRISRQMQNVGQGGQNFLDYIERNKDTVRRLVSESACVWCNEKPIFVGQEVPVIYPCKFSESRSDYVCEACIPDIDVQRMVGIG